MQHALDIANSRLCLPLTGSAVAAGADSTADRAQRPAEARALPKETQVAESRIQDSGYDEEL